MESNSGNAPPRLDKEGKGFKTWQKDTKLWCKITKHPEKNKASMIYLHGLQDNRKAKSVVQQIPEEKLQSNEGVEALMEVLEKALLPDKPMRLFNANKMFKDTKRRNNTKVHDFIIEFEHARYSAELEGITFDKTLLGLNLLDQCQLPEEKQQLVMSGLTEVNYENIKHKLQSIFFNEQEQVISQDQVNRSARDSESNTLFSSEPEVLYSNNYNRARGGRSYRSRGRGRGGDIRSTQRYSRSENQQPYRKMNPEDRNGRTTRCNICDSRFHWARSCPHAHENQGKYKEQKSKTRSNSDDEQFTLFVARAEKIENVTMFSGNNRNNKMKALREETRGCAIIDSGCATNVCGAQWMDDFKEALTAEQKEKIKEEPSDQYFSFGIGGTVKARCKTKVPCWLNGKRGSLTTHIVDEDMPLLLSKESLVRMNLIVDFGKALLSSSTGNTVVKLWNTRSGHFALPINL